jgi:hypothetical protein
VKEQEAARGRGKQGRVRGSTAGSIPSFESNEKKSSPTSVLRGPSELSTLSYGCTPFHILGNSDRSFSDVVQFVVNTQKEVEKINPPTN